MQYCAICFVREQHRICAHLNPIPHSFAWNWHQPPSPTEGFCMLHYSCYTPPQRLLQFSSARFAFRLPVRVQAFGVLSVFQRGNKHPLLGLRAETQRFPYREALLWLLERCREGWTQEGGWLAQEHAALMQLQKAHIWKGKVCADITVIAKEEKALSSVLKTLDPLLCKLTTPCFFPKINSLHSTSLVVSEDF